MLNLQKKIPKVSNSTQEFFTNLNNSKDEVTDWNKYCNTLETADKSLITFLRDANYGTKNLETYQQYLRDTSKATSTFSNLTAKAGTLLKSFGAAMASIGINWMIGSAINLAVTFFDKIHTTLDKQREITDKMQSELSDIRSDLTEVNSQLQTTTDRINELNAKDSLSFIEKEELATLIAENDKPERKTILLAAQEAKKQSETAASVKKEFEKEYGNQTYTRTLFCL